MVFDTCKCKDFSNLDVLTFGTGWLAKLSHRYHSRIIPSSIGSQTSGFCFDGLDGFSSLDHCVFVRFNVTSADEVLRSGTC